MSSAVSADVARWMASAGRHQHQSVLPWVWDVLTEEDLARAPGVCVCVWGGGDSHRAMCTQGSRGEERDLEGGRAGDTTSVQTALGVW